jgi:hypothetical protein
VGRYNLKKVRDVEVKGIIRLISQGAFENLDENADNNRVVKYQRENIRISSKGSIRNFKYRAA